MNLRTKAGVLQAIWDKLEIPNKESVVEIEFMIWVDDKMFQLYLGVENSRLVVIEDRGNIEKKKILGTLKTLYHSIFFLKSAVVSWSNSEDRKFLVAHLDKERDKVVLEIHSA